jgi:diguanylate cyclase (GGDEF)-like protein
MREWRQPPWELHEFSKMNRGYQAWVIASSVACVAIAVVCGQYLGVFDSNIDPKFVIVSLVFITPLSWTVMKSSTATSIELAAIGFLTLALARHYEAAAACAVWYTIMQPIRKPLVAHLRIFNLVTIVAVVMNCAVIFKWAGGDAVPGSGRWIAAAMLTLGVFFVWEFVLYGTTTIVGRYEHFKPMFENWARASFAQLMVMAPMAILIAALIAERPWPYLFALFIPALTIFDLFRTNDKLVEVRDEANRDALTGLHNRRALMVKAEQTVGEHSDGVCDWILMCDLDDFKRLNDTKGHDAGDHALVTAAQQIRESVRPGDFSARFGGEEFVVLFRDVDERAIERLAERIRSDIAFALSDVGVTVSIGVAEITAGDTADTAITRADSAMYKSKHSGKNRVTIWHPEIVGTIGKVDAA